MAQFVERRKVNSEDYQECRECREHTAKKPYILCFSCNEKRKTPAFSAGNSSEIVDPALARAELRAHARNILNECVEDVNMIFGPEIKDEYIAIINTLFIFKTRQEFGNGY